MSQMSNLIKIRPVEPICSMRKNRRTDLTKLKLAFHSFAKAPKEFGVLMGHDKKWYRVPIGTDGRSVPTLCNCFLYLPENGHVEVDGTYQRSMWN
jgi:hypothetical protein